MVEEKFTFEVSDSYIKPYPNIGDMWHMEGLIRTTGGVFGKYVFIADWDKQPQGMALLLSPEYLGIHEYIIEIKFFYEKEKIIFSIGDAPDDLPEEFQNTVKHLVTVKQLQALDDYRLNTILELINLFWFLIHG